MIQVYPNVPGEITRAAGKAAVRGYLTCMLERRGHTACRRRSTMRLIAERNRRFVAPDAVFDASLAFAARAAIALPIQDTHCKCSANRR